MKAERRLCEYFLSQRYFSIWPPGQRRGKERKYRILRKQFAPVCYEGLRIEHTLFGPRTVGTRKKPRRFDLVATPVPKRAELAVIEIKTGRIIPSDVVQLLGYINFLRFLQKYLGKRGRRNLSRELKFNFTGRTKLHGILVGKELRPRLVDYLPEEVLNIITLCTFKVVKGHWPIDLEKVVVHDRTYPATQRRAMEGRKLRHLFR